MTIAIAKIESAFILLLGGLPWGRACWQTCEAKTLSEHTSGQIALAFF